jgi:flagellar biosynthetic protein FliP
MPPLIVTVMLGLTLSTLTMSPVFRRSMTALSDAQIQQNQQAQQARQTQPASATPWQMGLAPLSQFLTEHTRPEDRQLVSALLSRANRQHAATVETGDLSFHLASFFLSELRAAFSLAFLLLLPFLLLDLVAAFLLSGLSISGLSARTVTLPFKLLLFLLCDGFSLLYRALLLRTP